MSDDEVGTFASEPEHPLVAGLRPDPAEPVEPTVTMTGLLGRSESDQRRRLYFSPQLDTYTEFPVEDVLHHTQIPADQSPIPGHPVTQVVVRHDAPITYVRPAVAAPEDEFDLDPRLHPPSYGGGPQPPRYSPHDVRTWATYICPWGKPPLKPSPFPPRLP
jgi:hypothetical protein